MENVHGFTGIVGGFVLVSVLEMFQVGPFRFWVVVVFAAEAFFPRPLEAVEAVEVEMGQPRKATSLA